MSLAGQNVVRSATPLLASVLCDSSVRRDIDQLVVEGHTDNTVPWGMSAESGRRYNLELSQRRSMDFVTTSTGALNGDAKLECYLRLVSATGRGQEDPQPGVPADAAPQRRVVLRVRLSRQDKDTTRILPLQLGR
jgi:outer membrane protein OmpA-like peptidoglycan-associated protein